MKFEVYTAEIITCCIWRSGQQPPPPRTYSSQQQYAITKMNAFRTPHNKLSCGLHLAASCFWNSNAVDTTAVVCSRNYMLLLCTFIWSLLEQPNDFILLSVCTPIFPFSCSLPGTRAQTGTAPDPYRLCNEIFQRKISRFQIYCRWRTVSKIWIWPVSEKDIHL